MRFLVALLFVSLSISACARPRLECPALNWGRCNTVAVGDTQQASNSATVLQEYEDSEFWSFHGYRLKITDSLLVIFTLGLFLATVLLWWSTRSLVKGAEDTAQRQLRAYVHVTKCTIQCMPSRLGTGTPSTTMEPGHWPFAKVDFKNAGVTPATHLELVGEIQLVSWPINKAHLKKLVDQGPKESLGPGTMSAVMLIYDSNDTALKDADRADFQARRKVLVAHGEARYRDVFGKPHVTEFRHYIGGNAELTFGDAPFGEGNEAN
jgi:hypothetical protein